MNSKEFNALATDVNVREIEIMGFKASEYSEGENRLQNFEEIADFFGDTPVVITPALVAFIFKMKHVQSMKNALMTGKIRFCWEDEEGEGFMQRVSDDRNYDLLILANVKKQGDAIK